MENEEPSQRDMEASNLRLFEVFKADRDEQVARSIAEILEVHTVTDDEIDQANHIDPTRVTAIMSRIEFSTRLRDTNYRGALVCASTDLEVAKNLCNLGALYAEQVPARQQELSKVVKRILATKVSALETTPQPLGENRSLQHTSVILGQTADTGTKYNSSIVSTTNAGDTLNGTRVTKQNEFRATTPTFFLHGSTSEGNHISTVPTRTGAVHVHNTSAEKPHMLIDLELKSRDRFFLELKTYRDTGIAFDRQIYIHTSVQFSIRNKFEQKYEDCRADPTCWKQWPDKQLAQRLNSIQSAKRTLQSHT